MNSDEFNTKCSIDHNEELGRYIKTQEIIKAGETILWEKPIAIIPHQFDQRCSNCFKYAATYCRACSITPLCSECSNHNNYDCGILSGMSNVDFENLKHYPNSYVLLKLLLLNENPDTELSFQELLKLESHINKRRNTRIWNDYYQNAVEPILKYSLKDHLKVGLQMTEDFLQHLCGILDVNAYEIRAPDGGTMRALYLQASLLTHACNANCNVAIDHEHRIKIYANCCINKNELITNCYTNALLGTNDRRHILSEGKYFTCRCLRCEDPTELGSHMSTLICGPCSLNHRNGILTRNQAANNNWTCQNCQYSLRNEQVLNIIGKIKEEIYHAADDINTYENLLAKFSAILHKNHYVMVDIKQRIASLIRSFIVNIYPRPNRHAFERIVRLCQELVMVLHTIQPGISRLKAIALYELGIASVQLYHLRFNEHEIGILELLNLLKQCEGMLHESIRMLSYEPTHTPEGQLARNAMITLTDLQNDINLMEKQNIKP